MNICIFFWGAVVGLLISPKIAGVLISIVESQIKIFERQVVILKILRKRYKDKSAVFLFKKSNKKFFLFHFFFCNFD